MTGWYDDALSEEQLERFEEDWLKVCGPCDYGLNEYGCNCPSGDPRYAISRLIQEVKRLREIEARMKDLET